MRFVAKEMFLQLLKYFGRLDFLLRSEAEALRKEKKRSSVTGLHQYLHILDRWPVFPCLMDGDTVISFPPVTNSTNSRISETTRTLLVEVTCHACHVSRVS